MILAAAGTEGCFSGCKDGFHLPKMRPSPYFGKIDGINYPEVDAIGEHHYGFAWYEPAGLFYCSKAGYIDLGHLRDSADRTKYIFDLARCALSNGDTAMCFHAAEASSYSIHLTYPEDWASLSDEEREIISREVSAAIGRYITFTSDIFHEIVTWFGWKSTGVFSEKHSAFSWEDMYSDCVGSRIAETLLAQGCEDFDAGMTAATPIELKRLGVQSPEIAKKATAAIEGKWFAGLYPFITMYKRNFDVGLDDGAITPFRIEGIVPGVGCEECVVPNLETLEKYGFGMTVNVKPQGFEKKAVYTALRMPEGVFLDPVRDFPVLIGHIKEQAMQEVGDAIDVPILE